MRPRSLAVMGTMGRMDAREASHWGAQGLSRDAVSAAAVGSWPCRTVLDRADGLRMDARYVFDLFQAAGVGRGKRKPLRPGGLACVFLDRTRFGAVRCGISGVLRRRYRTIFMDCLRFVSVLWRAFFSERFCC